MKSYFIRIDTTEIMLLKINKVSLSLWHHPFTTAFLDSSLNFVHQPVCVNERVNDDFAGYSVWENMTRVLMFAQINFA